MSVSSSANRQLRSLPSDVSRIRLQLAQNGRLTEAMKPTTSTAVGVLVIERRRTRDPGPARAIADRILAARRSMDLGGKQDLLSLPVMAGVERHVLDEPQLQPVPPGKLRQRDHVVLGLAPNRDGVDLHRVEPGLLGREDPLDHLLEARAAASAARTGPGPSCPG